MGDNCIRLNNRPKNAGLRAGIFFIDGGRKYRKCRENQIINKYM